MYSHAGASALSDEEANANRAGLVLDAASPRQADKKHSGSCVLDTSRIQSKNKISAAFAPSYKLADVVPPGD